ncbi:MAG: hypothetical protein JWL83_2221 [Actinomycetia bacterium]|nr:hypothetical protein [Actinomycetes bacterium]
MASQQRFEGPVLEDLLDRVRADAGPGAQIVAANRVRKGGLGGFFSREYFEVIVDLANGSFAEPEPPSPAPAVAIVLDAQDRDLVSQTTRRAPRAQRSAANGAGTTGDARRVPASILDLAEAVNNNERHGRRPDQHDVIDLVDDPPLMSTESPRFASILERIAHEVEVVDNGHHDGLVDDSDDLEVDVEPMPYEPPPLGIAALQPRPPRSDGIAEEVRERLEHVADTARRTATAARITTDPGVTAAALPVVTPTAFGAVADGTKVAAARRVPHTEAVIERPETALARLGLPARLVPRGAAPEQLRGALIESLANLPAVPALPEAHGVLIAVVGTGASAVLLARELCAEYGLDTERIVLATQEPLGEGIPAWLQICDGATAEERRRSWRRRPSPTIVAVNLGEGRRDLGWAREILDQLEPTLAWSVINAGWKSEDVRDWIERLGGIDAIALNHLGETVSPAAALELGVPIGRLDGRPATAIAWAELLTGRLH